MYIVLSYFLEKCTFCNSGLKAMETLILHGQPQVNQSSVRQTKNFWTSSAAACVGSSQKAWHSDTGHSLADKTGKYKAGPTVRTQRYLSSCLMWRKLSHMKACSINLKTPALSVATMSVQWRKKSADLGS